MLTITDVTKYFGEHLVLNNINLCVKPGNIIGLIGPSGSGKSTLLRCIIGLEKVDSGTINIDSNERLGMVFQQFNLFNNMTLMQNLVYPQVTSLKRDEKESHHKAQIMLDNMQLSGLENKLPKQLSGGQKQRAAIARTLCIDPSIILFDEPTSALDPENVVEVLNAIKKVASAGITILLATHEMSFAKELTDQIVFMDKGSILENTSTNEFFKKPATKRATSFLEKLLHISNE